MGNPQTRAKMRLINERIHTLVQVPNALIAQYKNGPFVDKNEKIVPQPKPGDVPVWMAVSIERGESFHAEMGGDGRHRNPGVIVIDLYSGIGKGTAAAEDIADSIKEVLRSTAEDGIIYQTVTVLPGMVPEDGAWFVTPVLIPYFYDD